MRGSFVRLFIVFAMVMSVLAVDSAGGSTAEADTHEWVGWIRQINEVERGDNYYYYDTEYTVAPGAWPDATGEYLRIERSYGVTCGPFVSGVHLQLVDGNGTGTGTAEIGFSSGGEWTIRVESLWDGTQTVQVEYIYCDGTTSRPPPLVGQCCQPIEIPFTVSPIPTGNTDADAQVLSDTVYWDANPEYRWQFGFRRAVCDDTIDSDSDGLGDCTEIDRRTDPYDPDSDDDGLSDGYEVAIGTDPTDSDSDDDSYSDAAEDAAGTDPNDPTDRPGSVDDSDGDGFPDEQDECPGQPGTVGGCPDTDGDGVPDSDDVCPGSVDSIDSDGDGIPDGCDGGLFDRQEVAERYAPEVRLHQDEESFPMSPAYFVNNSSLMWNHEQCKDSEVVPQGQVSAAALGLGGYNAQALVECSRFKREPVLGGPFYSTAQLTAPAEIDNPAKEPAGSREGFFLDMDNDLRRGFRPTATSAPPIFYEYVSDTDIVYWLFYGFNGRFYDSHEGDWEKIIVSVDSQGEAFQVRYYQHFCDPDDPSTDYRTYFWDEMVSNGFVTDGTHPIVYSALEAHASYPTNVDTEAFPCELANGVYDRTSDGGAIWKTWNHGVFDATEQPWYGFGGGWGRGDGKPGSPGWGPLGPSSYRVALIEN